MTTTVTSPTRPHTAAAPPPGALPRRSVMRRVSRGAVVLLASAGAVLRGERRAAAETYGCCTLAHKDDPSCSSRCGHTVRSWWCYSGSRLMGCHECTDGPNCWQGTVQCSWYDYPR